MIITLEADGQPRLDSFSDKKVPLDILLPQQSYFPNYPTHPVLRNINPGYAASISTGSDARSTLTDDSPAVSNTSNPKKLWRLFTSPFMKQKSPVDPFMSSSTIVEKPGQPGKPMALPLSWSELSTKWLIGWFLLSLLLCTVVAGGVWMAARRVDRNLRFQKMNSEWAVNDMNIYTLPPEQFGCHQAATSPVLNGSRITLTMPTGSSNDHTFIIRGGASGRLTIASSPDPSATSVIYDIVIQGSPASLDEVVFDEPGPNSATMSSTTFTIDTPIFMAPPPPGPTDVPSCIQFDITMYVPEALNKLTINITTPIQLTFSPQAHVELDRLVIGLTSNHPKSRIDVSESLHAKAMYIEMYTGIVQGIISIGNSLQITNWSGKIEIDAVPNVVDIIRPSPALLTTTTTKGNVDVRYLRNTAYRKRMIESHHTMGATSRGRFDYGHSEFDGVLLADSTKYNLTNARPSPPDMSPEDSGPVVLGNGTGQDRMYVKSGSGTIILPDIP